MKFRKPKQQGSKEMKGVVLDEGSIANGLHTRVAVKRPILIAILVTVMIVGGLTIFLVQKNNRQSNSTAENDATPAEFSGDEGLVASEASTKAAEGDFKGALKLVDDHIARNLENKREVAYLYSVKADLEARSVDYKVALESILKAVELDPTDPRYYTQAAGYYVLTGHQGNAREYYRRALSAYDAGLPSGYEGPDREFYQEMVSTLEAG